MRGVRPIEVLEQLAVEEEGVDVDNELVVDETEEVKLVEPWGVRFSLA
jgi:hypothetical protein